MSNYTTVSQLIDKLNKLVAEMPEIGEYRVVSYDEDLTSVSDVLQKLKVGWLVTGVDEYAQDVFWSNYTEMVNDVSLRSKHDMRSLVFKSVQIFNTNE